MDDVVFHLDPAKTALVVVDMQNDFCHPRGVFADGTWSIAAFTAAIEPNARLIARARAAGAAVIFTRILSETGASPHDAPNRIAPRLGFKRKRPAIVAGSWGGDIVDELQPLPGEAIIDKAGLSSFVDTDLDRVLKAKAIETVIITGVVTYACVLATAFGARDHGYNVLMVKDAVGSFWADLSDPVFKIVDLLMGYALTSDHIQFRAEAAAAA
jgi:nicotinamidase-related amidase